MEFNMTRGRLVMLLKKKKITLEWKSSVGRLFTTFTQNLCRTTKMHNKFYDGMGLKGNRLRKFIDVGVDKTCLSGCQEG